MLRNRFCTFLLVAGILPSSFLSAQHFDTLVIRNTGIDVLANAVRGDTLSDGRRADIDRVYILLRGERYINSKTITTNGYHLRISGQPAPLAGTDPGPAVIQLAPDSLRYLYGDRVTDRILLAHGDVTMSNVWVLSWVSAGASDDTPAASHPDHLPTRLHPSTRAGSRPRPTGRASAGPRGDPRGGGPSAAPRPSRCAKVPRRR